MTLSEAIDKRISRRTYLETPIEQEKLDKLEMLIERYNNESDLSMQLILNGSNAFNGLRKSYGMFRGVQKLIVLKGKKSDLFLKEKAGYFGEFLVLEATAMDLGTCWVGASFDKSDKVLDIKDDEDLACVITLGNTPTNNTFKEDMIRKMSHGKARSLEYFYTSDAISPDWFLKGMAAVRKAPSAMNRQKYKFSYENEKIIVSSENSAPYDMIDLGIAKAHFVIACGGHFPFGNNAEYQR